MVLGYWHEAVDEERITRLLGTRAFGTPAGNVRRLEEWGFGATYTQGTLAELVDLILNGVPCIAFVRTGQLPYWTEDTAHAVVVVGIGEEGELFVNDPATDAAPQSVPIGDFMLAWSEFDYRYAVIQPRPTTG